jgi:phage baseplate assembly protein W
MAIVNRADKYTSTSKKQDVYSDFIDTFDAHPETAQLVRVTNEDSIIQSIENLIRTNKYERYKNPRMGSNVKKLLFEPTSPITSSSLQNAIEETISNYEKRATLLDVTVSSSDDELSYLVRITFITSNISQPISFNLTLFRVR